MFTFIFGKISEGLRTIIADVKELTLAIRELNDELTRTKGLIEFFEQFGISFSQLFK